jgi:hypothetical protein
MSTARKITDYRKEQVKRLVLDCIMMRYSMDRVCTKKLHVKLS